MPLFCCPWLQDLMYSPVGSTAGEKHFLLHLLTSAAPNPAQQVARLGSWGEPPYRRAISRDLITPPYYAA